MFAEAQCVVVCVSPGLRKPGDESPYSAMLVERKFLLVKFVCTYPVGFVRLCGRFLYALHDKMSAWLSGDRWCLKCVPQRSLKPGVVSFVTEVCSTRAYSTCVSIVKYRPRNGFCVSHTVVVSSHCDVVC